MLIGLVIGSIGHRTVYPQEGILRLIDTRVVLE